MLPLRALVLVDKEGAHSFIELGVIHVALTHAVFHLEHIFDAHALSSLNLLEDNRQ